jgi:hypothetical protein
MRLTLLRCTKPGSWHVSPAPAAHTHSLAPPQQLSKPGLWHVSPSLQLIRTPWYHLGSYQSPVPGMYRQRLPLIRTPWHHLGSYRSFGSWHAWSLACIASACSSYALLGTTSSAISSSPIVAVRIALKRSFCGLVPFETSTILFVLRFEFRS